MTEYVDSLNSTPEGKAKLNEMTRNAYMGGKLDDIPRSDGSYYVVKSGKANKYRYYDNSGLEKYVYEREFGITKALTAVLKRDIDYQVTRSGRLIFTVVFTAEDELPA